VENVCEERVFEQKKSKSNQTKMLKRKTGAKKNQRKTKNQKANFKKKTKQIKNNRYASPGPLRSLPEKKKEDFQSLPNDSINHRKPPPNVFIIISPHINTSHEAARWGVK